MCYTENTAGSDCRPHRVLPRPTAEISIGVVNLLEPGGFFIFAENAAPIFFSEFGRCASLFYIFSAAGVAITDCGNFNRGW